MTKTNNTAKTRRAIKTYTRAKCMQAYAYSCDGEGPSTIGWYLGLTTGQANAAINAGRELSAQQTNEIYHIGVWEGSNGDQWHELGTITQCTRQQAEEYADTLCDRTEFDGEWYCYSSGELRTAMEEVRGER